MIDKERYIRIFNETIRIRNLGFNTIENYNGHLNLFLDYCEMIGKLPEDFDTNDLRTYLAKDNISASTIGQRRGMLCNLLDCFGMGFKLYPIKPPRREHRLPDFFSVPELNKIFSSIKNEKQRCIVKLQYACALRVHEVVKIKRSDFIKIWDAHDEKFVYDLRILGKGLKERIVPVPEETIAEIFSYWKNSTEKKGEYLFPGQQSLWYNERSVQMVVKRAMIENRIFKNGSTHLLRHSRATHLHQAGVDILYIKELLGHERLKTTEVYTHLNKGELRIVFRKAETFLNDALMGEINRQKRISA